MPEEPAKLQGYVTAIVSAYVNNNTILVSELPALIEKVQTALDRLAEGGGAQELRPVVPIAESVTREYIVCLEDGKPFRSMRRHLRVVYGMTPEQYRAKWSLPLDYPMNAPSLTEKRSETARELGLGQVWKRVSTDK